jgi:hypothetical protein
MVKPFEPPTARHRFLRDLHTLIQPQTYLEIGVQRGHSLAMAGANTFAYAIDPNPIIEVPIAARHQLYAETSDEFFANWPTATNDRLQPPHPALGLAFIDGMHLAEFALRDFIGVEQMMGRSGVVVFDDVLPYDPAIAGREPLPGDWTGDVWKIYEILRYFRPDLTLILVDVNPTGALAVVGLDPDNRTLSESYDTIIDKHIMGWDGVPDQFVNRTTALPPAAALAAIEKARHHL